ncbi:hypothetical protein [Microbacterium allomyrinae]|uniref:hypothetical protein n=1 Tax=Microbacterium allomyrinae TaxID=2830666 RepID=UPI001E4DB302|nr:hypothetical protein [Microbacterium allomyrinae]
MRVVLDAVGKGRRDRALPPTSTVFETGRVTLAFAETEQRPTVLGLIAAGRMRPDTGGVLIDGRTDASALRRRVALVDALDVSEPEPNVTLAGVVAEELMFAGRRSDPLAVRRWLEENALAPLASLPIANVEPADRVRALCELAVLRKGVEGIVLVSPDRHGGEPETWWHIAQGFAARGLAVLVIAGRASQSVLDRSPVDGGDQGSRALSRAGRVPPLRAAGGLSRSAAARSGIRLRRLTAPTKGARS